MILRSGQEDVKWRRCARARPTKIYGKCSACQSASRSGLILASIRKTPGAPSLTQVRNGIQIGNGPHRRRPCAIPARNGGEIRFRKLHDIDRVALAPKEMDFGSV